MSLHAVVSGWLLGPPSGANRRLLALVHALDGQLAADERVTVLHGLGFVPPGDLPRGVAFEPIDVPPGPIMRRALAERRLLPRRLTTLDATVHDHGFLPLPRVPVPSVLTVHDLRSVDGLTRWPRVLARCVLRRSCARAAAVVTPSAWTRDRLAALGVEGAVVVPNAVDPTGPGPFAPVRPLPKNGYLLHVGHLEPRKNLGVVLEALARLPAVERPELWLAGTDAGAGRELDRIAQRLGIAPSLTRIGRVPDAELAALYANARAVVLPSRHEGFGMPVLEAFAHGCPVVAADAGALPEVCGDAAVLLPPDDPAAWAEAIRSVDDGEAAGGRRRARAAMFDWRASAAALLSVWRAVSASR